MTQYSIRTGTTADLPKIFQLIVELAVFENEPNAVTATLGDYVSAFEDSRFFTIVAELDENIIGMVLYYNTFSTWKGKMMYLEDFYVQDTHRGQGVGRALFQAFLKDAKARGCVLTKWQVLDWNVGAQKFYQREGATIEKEWWNGKIYL